MIQEAPMGSYTQNLSMAYLIWDILIGVPLFYIHPILGIGFWTLHWGIRTRWGKWQ